MKPIILVAEDNVDLQSLLRHVLESDGYDVRVPSDGQGLSSCTTPSRRTFWCWIS